MSTENGEVISQVGSLTDLKPKMELRGKVKKIELYGAFVDLGVGTDGLLHISQLSTERVKNVSDVVKEGDEVTVWVRNVDVEKGRIDLTMIPMPEKTFNEVQVGQVLNGKVVRVEKFGAFIDVGAERPGMVHVSEMANGYVGSPQEVVKVGQDVEVKVIKVNNKKKQIDLSMKALEIHEITPDEDENEEVPTVMELALRRAMQGTDMADEFAATLKPAKQPRREKRTNDKRRQQQNEILTRTLQNRVK